MSTKILLNCLPPADVNNPSISLSILKKFMVNHGFETEVKYWNFQLSVMSAYIDTEDTEIKILPFLSMLNDREGNTRGNDRIISLLQKLQPSYKVIDPDYYSDFLQTKKEEIFDIIQRELAGIEFNEILLFGISAKYNQWIPGMILAGEIKKIAPEVKIIVGGFGSDKVARQAMEMCNDFDFVTWGEGEYPLLALAEQLKNTSPDYKTVPRLIYREAKVVTQSASNKSEYLDFDSYIYPDYDDYVNSFPAHLDKELINFPINTIRSCHWRKCKFCDFNKGYKLRIRKPECIVNEIEHLTNKYGHTTFTFVDSDTFGNQVHFEDLLDRIIALKYKNEQDYVFWAEIIPNNQFNAVLMQKMAIAGFKNLFIGYDALSDTLLQKMNKSNSFSDNLFFVKYALKNGINPLVNVIMHVPEETEAEVQECVNNLHFLRFFYNNSVISFSHTYVDLVLSSMTKYYAQMSGDDKENYDFDSFSYLLPHSFTNDENRFHLFRWKKSAPSNVREWEKLIEIEKYYKSKSFRYKVQEDKGIWYYTEYCNDEEIANIVFSEAEYPFVLQAAEQQVRNFDELFAEMKTVFPGLTEKKLKEILMHLKNDYLIYCNAEFSNIVSVVELRN